ncbi:MAG: hypothetical protein KKI08_23595 [Armatimonadetes bacterium]|nr:hypothetical protein [Armatimonadota bacterium]
MSGWMVKAMMGEALVVLVPAAAEGLLVGLSLSVWVRLRRLGIGGVYQLTVGAIVLDAVSQAWQLWARLGRPAGGGWLLHAAVSALTLYVLYRLGHLLARMRQACPPVGLVEEPVLAEEGG